MEQNLTGIFIRKHENTWVLRRVPNLCFTQITLDIAGLFFGVAIIYGMVENEISPSTFPFPLMIAGALIFLLFYLRRLANLIFGRVEINEEGVKWNHSVLGGWTFPKKLHWNEIEKIFSEHENPHPRNQTTTSYFLKIHTQNNQNWTLLRLVADYPDAIRTSDQLHGLLVTIAVRFQSKQK